MTGSRKEYYPGTDTKITDPFYIVDCACGYLGYAMHFSTTCPKCGREAECCPADKWKGQKNS